jgi:uncharacterized RDD family membrane protein YckC
MDTNSKNIGNRIIATLIDYTLIFCFYLFMIYRYGKSDGDGTYALFGLKAFIPLAFWFIYLVIIESIFGATAGHFIMGLKVIKTDKSPIDFTASMKRHILDPIDFFLGIPAIISINNTPLGQRLGDLWAKTIVIKDKD